MARERLVEICVEASQYYTGLKPVGDLVAEGRGMGEDKLNPEKLNSKEQKEAEELAYKFWGTGTTAVFPRPDHPDEFFREARDQIYLRRVAP